MTWTHFWRLSTDPFRAPGSPYVPTSGHDEAVARLVATIESAQRLAVVRGEEGSGKSTVIARAVSETRSPLRRVARSVSQLEGSAVIAALASGLGGRVAPDASRSGAWKSLTDAVRLARLQTQHVVLVVDDAHLLHEGPDTADIERLLHLDSAAGSRLTVIIATRQQAAEDTSSWARSRSGWPLAASVPPLTRSETALYIAAKLAAAGRDEPAFTPSAVDVLHQLSRGLARSLDRLATLALMAGAAGQSVTITQEMLEGVAGECDGYPRLLAG